MWLCTLFLEGISAISVGRLCRETRELLALNTGELRTARGISVSNHF